MARNETQGWQFCAYCGGELDTGWECNTCGADWMHLAHQRVVDLAPAALAAIDGARRREGRTNRLLVALWVVAMAAVVSGLLLG